MKRTAFLAAILVVLAMACAAQQPYAELKQSGPRNLLIALNCRTGDRPALRRAISTTAASRFSELSKQGELRSYRVLFNRFVDNGHLGCSDLARVRE